MLSKETAKALRQEFWTAYGQHMSRHRSMRGPKVKWLNYKTGIKDVFFRQEADQDRVGLAIEIQHSDPSIREVYYDQFWELETMLHSSTGSIWQWTRSHFQETGQEISRISVEQRGHSIYNKADWPAMFRFLERHMLPLDEVWAQAIDIFKDLER